jgi:signal transduction histidine kinase/DNA-binding response OmpR family regulator
MGDAYFEIEDVVYRYDPGLDSIVPMPSFGDAFGLSGMIVPKLEDRHGNIWMWAQIDESDKKHRVVARKQSDNTYKTERILVDRITQNVKRVLYPEDDGVVWYGGSGGIVRHDLNLSHNHKLNYNALIRKISADGDSLIFVGATTVDRKSALPYTSNALRFEYAATSFDDVKANQFQYLLEGFDEDWSTWSQETKKDYTNIPEGNYRFKVRAKNSYGHLSEADEYTFEILPPMHRTLWAYSLYTLLVIALVTALVKWRSRQLQKDKEALVDLVAERTEEIRQQAKKLEQLDRDKSRFFTNISHEFRTPLTLITGMASELLGNPRASLDEGLRMIIRNGEYVHRLINQLLDLSKLQSGALKVHLQHSEIISFLRYITGSFESYANQKDISIQFISQEEEIGMDYDPDKVLKILSNLLSNAIRFTPSGGAVSVEVNLTDHTKDVLEIIVSDNGQGIAEGDLPHIFDRFYQADSPGKHSVQGTGIGLALTRELLLLLDGEITVQSEEGQGTEFVIRLPVTSVAREQYIPDEKQLDESLRSYFEGKAELGPSGEGEKPVVLIVEDHADVASFLTLCLEEEYKLQTAGNGKEGWDIAVTEIPDAVISDVMMPEMDGFELCRKIKTDMRTSHIPVVLLTAKADQEARVKGLEHGADAYVTKPFDKAELLTRLRKLLELRRTLQQKFSQGALFAPVSVIKGATLDEKFIATLNSILEKELDNEEFGIAGLCREAGVSRVQLHRKLKALTELSASHYIRRFRLHRAVGLIRTTDLTMAEIAYSVGFKSPAYFSQVFSETFGYPPSELKQTAGN